VVTVTDPYGCILGFLNRYHGQERPENQNTTFLSLFETQNPVAAEFIFPQPISPSGIFQILLSYVLVLHLVTFRGDLQRHFEATRFLHLNVLNSEYLVSNNMIMQFQPYVTSSPIATSSLSHNNTALSLSVWHSVAEKLMVSPCKPASPLIL
jgi:hypothetical protein